MLRVSSFLFRVQVFAELFGRHAALDAPGGHVRFRDPEQRVEDYFALVRVAPIGVGMSSGKTEAAPAARAFAVPHHRFLTATGVDDMLIGSAPTDIKPAAKLPGPFGIE